MNEIIRFSTNVRNFFNVEKTPKTFQNLTQIWRNGMLTEKSNFQWTIKIILDFPCRVLRLVKIMASPSYLTLSLSTMATTMREVRVSKWVLNYQWYDDAFFVWSCSGHNRPPPWHTFTFFMRVILSLSLFQVAIVHHLDMPIMRQRAFHIAPGTENQIPITPTLYTANPQVTMKKCLGIFASFHWSPMNLCANLLPINQTLDILCIFKALLRQFLVFARKFHFFHANFRHWFDANFSRESLRWC